jgi:threonine dehydrogenase-like Zn-dependent dehydrogenase
MKALAVDAPGHARVIEIPEPTAAPDGQSLLEVRRIGLCGTDLNTFRGRNPMVTYPRILGHEVAATVITNSASTAPARNVTLSPYTACGACPSCRNGRVNACQFNQTLGVQRDGALTERITYPSDKLYTGNLSLEELCLVEPLTVGVHASARGQVSANDTVAIFGCGGVGLGAVAGAAFRGARVIAIDVDDKKLELACAAGATDVIHSSREDLHQRLSALTAGEGPSCIIEAIGLPQTFRAAVEEVAFSGRVVYIGYAKEPVSYETRLFVQKELQILGSRNALPDDFLEVIRMLEAKRFPVQQSISAIVPIEEAPGMLRRWSENPSSFAKIMVKLS